MKNIAMAVVLLLTSTLSYAKIERSEISRVCLGEFAEDIVESVKSCSAKDLAQAQVEIYKLEEEMESLKAQIEKAEAYVASPEYANDKKKMPRLMTTVLGGAVLGLVVAGVGYKMGNSKVSGAGMMVTILLLWGVGYGSMKMGYQPVEFEPSEIPEMKNKVSFVLEQVRIRKALLEAANAIKAAQTTAVAN